MTNEPVERRILRLLVKEPLTVLQIHDHKFGLALVALSDRLYEMRRDGLISLGERKKLQITIKGQDLLESAE